MITGKNYIGWELKASGNITYTTLNPKTNLENETIFLEATKEEVNRAVELAASAFEEYRNRSDNERAGFLEAIASEIEALGEDLTDIYTKESGLPEGRAKGETARTVGQLRAFATMLNEGSWIEAIISRSPEKPDIRRMQIPLGSVVVFGASNFPLAFSTAGGDTASALAAGCPVVVKSHPMHAGTGEMVASAVIRAAKATGMPNGVFSNLNSKGITVGQLLVQHPGIKAVGFTGSFRGGMALSKIASERKIPVPVYAEMGSVNPIVVLPSALKEKKKFWAEQYASSVTLGAGQFCTNPGLILGIAGKELDDFVSLLGEFIGEVEPACMLHSNIKKQYEETKSQVLAHGKFSEVSKFLNQVDGNFVTPHVVAVDGSDFKENLNFQKEVFGPFSLVVECKDKEELEEIIQSLEGQLTGTILSEDPEELSSYSKVIDGLKESVGRLIYNNMPTGVEVCAAMTHGGPFPATSDSKFTSVGITAVKRWVRPVSYQDWPDSQLPEALQNNNPLKILRNVNGEVTRSAL